MEGGRKRRSRREGRSVTNRWKKGGWRGEKRREE